MKIKEGDFISFYEEHPKRRGGTYKIKVWAEVKSIHIPAPHEREYSTDLGTVRPNDIIELILEADVRPAEKKAGRIFEH